jgi:hypothetical protein
MDGQTYLGILKKITIQRCDIYFASDKEVCLPHSRLLGEYTDEV